MGAFVVKVNGRSLEFATDKVRALLAYLAVEAGRPHRRDSLAALLWPDQPDSQAKSNLRLTLHRLRQAFDKAESDLSQSLFTIQRNTVESHLAEQVDVFRFQTLLRQSEEHDHERLENCADCVARLEEAANLAAGELLAGLSLPDASTFEEWLLVQREFLHQQALLLLHTLTAVYTTTADYDKAITIAQRQLELEPWYEVAHQQLMRALALSGQRDRALAQFAVCRQVLWEELGIEPMAETAVLVEQIKNNDLTPEAQSTQLYHFPVQFTPFVGRQADLQAIAEQLANPDCRLLTLVGAGGIGKTRLAIQVAHHLAANGVVYVDGIHFVTLAQVMDEAKILTAVTSQLGLQLSESSDQWQEMLTLMQAKQMLMVLDNVEQLPRAAPTLAAFLKAVPHVQLLATSREPLHLRAETLFPLKGLSEQEGRQLFMQSARQIVPGFALDTAAEVAVCELCQLLDGSPLAIEMAAAWVKLLDCQAILKETQQNLDFLVAQRHDIPERQRSLRAVFAYSWGTLPAKQQQILAQCALFPTDFALEAVQAIVPQASILDMATLLDKSLLRRTVNGRYQLHPLLRQFAAEKLADLPDVAELYGRYSRHYLAFVAEASPFMQGQDTQQTINGIRRDWVHIEQAWQWALAQRQLDLLASCWQGFGRFYAGVGWFAEGQQVMTQALAVLGDDGDGDNEKTAVLRAQFSLHQAYFLGQQGDYKQAKSASERALALALRLADDELQGRALSQMGEWLRHLGQYEGAMEMLETAVAHLQPHAQPSSLAYALNETGMVHLRQGRFDEAVYAFQQALSHYEQIQHQMEISTTLGNLGYVFTTKGDWPQAEDYLQRALAVAEAIGFRLGMVKHYLGLGKIASERKSLDEGKALIDTAVTIAQEIGYLRGRLTGHLYQGDLLLHSGELAEARVIFDRALPLCQQAGLLDLVAQVNGRLGILNTRKGDFSEAIVHYNQAIALFTEMNEYGELGNTLGNLGGVYYHQNKLDEAAEKFDMAYVMARKIGAMQRQAHNLTNLGLVTRSQGDYDKSAVYYQKALQLYESLGNQQGHARTIGSFGILKWDMGDFDAARALFNQALTIYKIIGGFLVTSIWHHNLGLLHLDLGELDMALAKINEALALLAQTQSPHYQATASVSKAKILYAMGRFVESRLVLDEGLQTGEGRGLRTVDLDGRLLDAKLTEQEKDMETAVTHIQSLLEAFAGDAEAEAEIYYEWWLLSGEDGVRETAVSLNQKLYESFPKYSFKMRLERLSGSIPL